MFACREISDNPTTETMNKVCGRSGRTSTAHQHNAPFLAPEGAGDVI
jgi:hypothetical protein